MVVHIWALVEKAFPAAQANTVKKTLAWTAPETESTGELFIGWREGYLAGQTMRFVKVHYGRYGIIALKEFLYWATPRAPFENFRPSFWEPKKNISL